MEQLRNAQSRLDFVTEELDAVWVKFNEAVGERNTIAGRLDSVVHLMRHACMNGYERLQALDELVRSWEPAVENLCPKCGKHIRTNPLLDTHACG